jgi:hypothetical protein
LFVLYSLWGMLVLFFNPNSLMPSIV